ncbi:bacterial Ig-like domain, group 2 [Leptospira inadai serovar Lyme str. 10]|uniref:Bacterial Ig-like domain, group 2 n=2 Tax=Leptospira inadai serovar Lyme TaxID=293084 RepID=V6HZ06_9LEPT|nr:Ig-like domain-containing protein [Leptospira inadai]EQA38254.1 bacterial Ig-like domain, group 2 [Leptospira inadai serovar Lyme str. 10]PNV74014.1 hypothetical protein BES34_015795 [Leptospira inadai serovar Lyme]
MYRIIKHTKRASFPILLFFLLEGCAAWPLLTGAVGLAAGKTGSGPLFFLPGSAASQPATLNRVEISSPYSSLAKTTTAPLKATAIYSDNTNADITGDANWSSADSSVIKMLSGGTAQGIQVGSTTITIEYQGKTAQIQLTVSSAPLSSLTITCTNQNSNLPKGTSRQCSLTGNFADGTAQDLTLDPSTSWSVSNSSVATVDANGLVKGVAVGSTSIRAGYQGLTASLPISISQASLVSISITPVNSSLPLGKTQQFTATGTYSDNSTQNITSQVTWTSSDTSIATIGNSSGNQGFLSTQAQGSATITAALGSVSNQTQITVTAALLESISITPANPSIAKGRTLNLVATGIFTDGSRSTITTQVTWSSDNTGIVSVDNGSGLEGRATAVNVGTANVTAAIGGISSTVSFQVTAAVLTSIQVTPDDTSIPRGTSTNLLASGIYSDGTSQNISDQVSWTTSNTSVLQLGSLNGVPKKGVLSPNSGSLGSARITATLGSISGYADITVTSAKLLSIQVDPTAPSVAKGLTKNFTATGTYTDATTQDLTTQVTWTSSNTGIATISNASGTQGTATGLSIGTSNITASLGSVTSPANTLTVTAATLQSITINPSLPSIPKGRSQNLTATGTYSDGSTSDLTTQVTWTSSDSSIAIVDNTSGNQGKASGVSQGSVSIGAAFGSISGTVTLTVTSAVLDSIQVSIVDTSIAKGTSTQAEAVGIYSDGTHSNISDQVVWTSSQTSIIQLGVLLSGPKKQLNSPNNGSQGSSRITATLNSVSGYADLSVTAPRLVSIQVDPTNPTVANGLTKNFTATGTYTDGSVQDLTSQVTWSSSNTSVATISNVSGSQGTATTLQTGTSNITAQSGSVVSPISVLTVGAATLVSITIAPSPTVSISKGLTRNFTATGHYSDNSTQDITTQVTWSSFDQTKATISNASGSQGTVTALLEGSTQISATLNSIQSSDTAVTVTAAVLQSIQVTPANSNLPKGNTTGFTANGVYSDGTTLDLTTQVTWSSSNTASATISNAGGTQGTATAVNIGSTTISAQSGSTTGSTTLTVTAAVLVSISVAPNGSSVYTGYTKNFTATGTYSDASTQDLTTQAVWASSDTSKATISNANGTQGQVTGVAAGTVTISATFGSVSGNTSLTVVYLDTTPPTVLNAVSLSPTTVRVTYSELVNAAQATTASNYKLALTSSVSGSCSNNSNFSSSLAISVSSVSGTGAVYTITLSSSQVSGTSYTLIVNKSGVQDLSAIPNSLACPNYGDFIGQEQLKVSSAACASTSSVVLNFSKPVLSGNNASGSAECSSSTECANRYKFVGTTDLGSISSAKILDGTVCNGTPADSAKVCITHALLQTGSQYTIIAANALDGDGFDNSTWGSVRNAGNSENVQASPRDRATFSGCGTSPVNFSDGPISVDPNGSTFGYLADFNSKIYTGPNNGGNGALRFAYDGSVPESVQFTFAQDTIVQNAGSGDNPRTSTNSATSRENGIAVPPYVTLGHSGCTINDATLTNGCGPDNESGRGVFTTGTLSGSPYIFIAAARTTPDGSGNYYFDYLYYSSDTSSNLGFKYIDMSTITGTVTAGTSAITVQNDRVFPGFAKPNYNGTSGFNAPDFGFISFNSADSGTGNCTAGSNCDAYDGSKGRRIRIDYMPYFGGASSSGGNNASPNWAYYVGVDSLFVFNNRIYAANGGLHAVGHNGSIIRSNTADPTTACSSQDTCANWTEIGPRTNSKWHNSATNNWFSLELAKFYDLIPADRAFAQFAEFNGNLYVTRTLCVQGTQATGFRTGPGTVAGCTDGTDGNRKAQLWKCDPTITGSATDCDSGDWSVVADDGTGFTNFGDSTNRTITMVAKNGSYLYVGFDNSSGIRIYRTNTTNPGSSSSSWTQVAGNGLTDSTNVQQIFSAVSVSVGGLNYLYLSVGKNSTPVRVYRQQNQ